MTCRGCRRGARGRPGRGGPPGRLPVRRHDPATDEPDAFDMVIRSIRAPVRRIESSSAPRAPNTFSPAIEFPQRDSSLSRKPTGRTFARRSARAERAITAPSRPAPNSSAGTRTAVSSPARPVVMSFTARIANRAIPRTPRASVSSRNQNDGLSRAADGMPVNSCSRLTIVKAMAVPAPKAQTTWRRSGTLAWTQSRLYRPNQVLTPRWTAIGIAAAGR